VVTHTVFVIAIDGWMTCTVAESSSVTVPSPTALPVTVAVLTMSWLPFSFACRAVTVQS
jgi:hypothetical protein